MFQKTVTGQKPVAPIPRVGGPSDLRKSRFQQGPGELQWIL